MVQREPVISWTEFAELKDCGVLEYPRYADERGYFQEVWNRKTLAEAGVPLPWNWAQDNVSFSHEGVLRGFHIQRKNPQGKLITCIYGKIMDVCVDLRANSPTFLRMTRIVLSGDHPQSFYCPPGTAHGFIAFEPSLIHYRCTTPYDQESDGGINALSPELAMVWPPGKFFRSEKDRTLPMLMDYLKAMA